MNPDLALQIRDRIRSNTKEIRLLCPRGHLIAHIALWVPEGTGMLAMHPRGPGKRYVGNVHEGRHGFRMDTHAPTGSFNVALLCTRCTYTGSHPYLPLALELAAAALDGHRQHRLAS